MIIPQIKKDVKTLTNEELIKEKNQLQKNISKVEQRHINNCLPVVWIEDEDVQYIWDLQRLQLILVEIESRTLKEQWIF